MFLFTNWFVRFEGLVGQFLHVAPDEALVKATKKKLEDKLKIYFEPAIGLT
jgi:hypothetical protein